ncbi:MAG: prepilin-type N-terminal cleavage/methylation domain-containing protein [Candidatus Omnitrophica bacterium]|nr:prepilin-type N-terminal cleavage/methylation domain-containing protein [Candidatus Omnitrophota bacterium]
MDKQKGFTLLELLMVVIIIGVLAAIAVPQYLKTREKARMSEALSVLGQIRSAEARYYAERSTYTGVVNELDFSPTDVAGTLVYTYTISGASATNFVAVATRGGAPAVGPSCTAGYAVRINQAGTICGTDCQTTAATCP